MKQDILDLYKEKDLRKTSDGRSKINIINAAISCKDMCDKDLFYCYDGKKDVGVICDFIINNNINLRISDEKYRNEIILFDKKKKDGRIITAEQKIRKYIEDNVNANTYQLGDFFDCLISKAVGYKNISKDISIINGKDITSYYEEEGKKFHSCMGGKKSRFTKFYADNPDKVSMVIFGDKKARALLWTSDSGDKVLDRIYPANSKFAWFIYEWAKAKGCVVREIPYLDCPTCDDSVEFTNLTKQNVTMKLLRKTFPYLDTFKFGVVKKIGEIVLCNYKPDKSHITITTTIGGFYGKTKGFVEECCCVCKISSACSKLKLVGNEYYCKYCR